MTGTVNISPAAKEAQEKSGVDWKDIWPRHTRKMLPGKNILTMLDIPGAILVVTTNQEHTETNVVTIGEFATK
jgi:hypothetical protein